MSDKAQPPEKLRSELDADETVVWFGSPVNYWSHLLRSILPFMIGLFALLFLAGVISSPDETTRVNGNLVPNRDAFDKMLPIMAIMAWFSIGVFSPLITLLRARESIYAITDKRLISISGLRRKTVQSWSLDRLAGLERRSGYSGAGDIYFAVQNPVPALFDGVLRSLSFWGVSYVSVEFLGVANAIEVEKTIRATAKSFAKSEGL